MPNNRILVTVLGIVAISLTLIVLITFTINQNNLPNDIVSQPNNIDDDENNVPTPDFTTETLNLKYIFLSSGEPSGNELNLSFNKRNVLLVTQQGVNYRTFESSDYGIIFMTSSEETSNEQAFIPQNAKIESNNLNKPIFQVQSYEQFTNEFRSFYSNLYSNYYFYTTEFKTGDACGDIGVETNQKFCGSRSIKIEEGYPLRVYCGANSTEALDECDKVVKSLDASPI